MADGASSLAPEAATAIRNIASVCGLSTGTSLTRAGARPTLTDRSHPAGAQIKLMRPGAGGLLNQLKIDFCDRLRFEAIFALHVEALPRLRPPDNPVDDRMDHMNALRAEFARKRLRQASKSKFCGGECGEAGARFD